MWAKRFVGRAFRHDSKAFLSSGVLTPEGETFFSSLLGIHRERLAPIQQYPNICESKRPFGRIKEENPHPSQKRSCEKTYLPMFLWVCGVIQNVYRGANNRL
jgi:hypothetical protein